MTGSSFKYHSRSPRYVLSPFENQLIRFAGPHSEPWEEQTVIENISMTGLIFSAPSDLCPVLGEMIKVQFFVPGGIQMACFARVTRLEKQQNEDFQKVAVRFEKLLPAHKAVLRRSLGQRWPAPEELIEESTPYNARKSAITWTSVLLLVLLLSGMMGIWFWTLTV